MIDISAVSFSYDGPRGFSVDIFSDVNFCIAENEIVGLTGPSGVGKTTLLRVLAGELPPTKGMISYRPDCLLAYTPQDDVLIEFRTAWENAGLLMEREAGGRTLGCDGFQFLLSAFEMLGLSGVMNNPPSQLSGGMRQRVQVLQGLAVNKSILLLDEPFSEQDFDRQVIMEDLLWSTARDRRESVVLVSHDVTSLAAVCDRVLFLGGRPSGIVDSFETPSALRRVGGKARRVGAAFSEFELELWRRRGATAAI